MQLDAHQRPPADLCDVYKLYHKRSAASLEAADDETVIDFHRGLSKAQASVVQKLDQSFDGELLRNIFATFLGGAESERAAADLTEPEPGFPGQLPVYEHKNLPNLLLIPNLIPYSVQRELLDRLLHRDLSNPEHKTNVHLHYDIEAPPHGSSFFARGRHDTEAIKPLSPSIHKPMTVEQFLDAKLRWITLGGQYDWTKKQYPREAPPSFPHDLYRLLKNLFPNTDAEAAIVNLYSPGDTLALHRDVSEECGNGLISLSIGCDCLFIVGHEAKDTTETPAYAVLRLHSGDVVYMSGPARFAWHGVPTVLGNTCPQSLEMWPGERTGSGDDKYAAWQGWMATKRVNVNVRQMK